MMKQLKQIFANPSGLDSLDNYAGEIPADSLRVVLGTNRDADLLTQSNWEVALERLGGESEAVVIHRFGHWLCGWLEYLCIDFATADRETIEEGFEIIEDLESYPVLDDDHFSQLESAEADRVWSEWYEPKERVEYIRRNRDQFDWCNFWDLQACIRGRYFGGYASELLN